MYGHLAAFNTEFQAQDDDADFRFWGVNSGYNATIKCDATCTLRCQSNGCSGMTYSNNLICSTGDDSDCTWIIEGTDQLSTFKSDVCPNGLEIESQYLSENYLNLSLNKTNYEKEIVPELFDIYTTKSNSISTCNATGAILCGDAAGCAYTNISNNNTICCSSNTGCLDTNITYTGSSHNSNVTHMIRCDGRYSCGSTSGVMTINGRGSGSYGADLYFTGEYAAYANGGTLIIETSDNNDIFCSATFACYSATIINFENLYCLGWSSCSYTTILLSASSSSSSKNIYFYGSESGVSTTIENIRGNIYCGTYYSCQSSSISNVDGNIFAVGQQSLDSSEIVNATGNVIGMGYRVVYNSRVENISLVSLLLFSL